MTEKKIVEISEEHDGCSENDLFLNDDERCFRIKTKSRFKNLTNAVTIIFRHIKDINKSLKELSETSTTNQMEIDECANSIIAITEALDSYGMADRMAAFGHTKKPDKIKEVAPIKRVADTEAFIPFKYVNLKNESRVVDEYPKCWDNFEYGFEYPKKIDSPLLADMSCRRCRFSVSISQNKKTVLECRYSKSPFYKYLIAPEEKRYCVYFSSTILFEDLPIIAVPKKIMIVNFHNLTDKPEINNYEI